ncbi:MAG: diadenylate cyclase CdaA [Firmicutes bacterium]|nr:diadenylate cyclase CdaA [Bacillota bacterium]
MQEFFYNILTGIGIMDIIDIAIVAYLIYRILMFIRSTRAEQLLKGLIVLVVITLASGLLNLHTLNWILRGIMTLGAVALVVVFQQELRRGLEYLGRTKFLKGSGMDKDKAKHITHEFIRAIETFSKDRTGALIVLERDTALSEMTESGTIINAEISAELLGNLFYEGSPLHDGAIIIRRDKVYAAGCVLPLTQNTDIGKELGTRHRAGIGITEHSDAVTLIVSEETGIISMAVDGKLQRFLDTKTVEKALLQLYLNEGEFGGRKAVLPEFLSKIWRKNDAEK